MNTEILIIEDNPVIRKELQTVLEGNKYHTSVIEDFSDVTEQVRKINPHLILLDIKLPQENGFTICSGIRSFSQAPIIFELKIMYYLFEHAGTICTRADLIEYLWDNQLYVDDNALSVNIGRIREKLSKIGVKDFIKTKHRQGYTL